MTFDMYQGWARLTAIYPNLNNNFIYPVLGLCGEAGEVAEKIKKIIRDDNEIISEDKKNEVAKEIGDVIWYAANLCSELGLRLDDVAELNIEKLKNRLEQNTLHGSGDNR